MLNNKNVMFKRSRLVALVAILLVIIVAGAYIKANSINSSPEKVAIATIKSEYEIDIKTMMKCLPDFTIKELADEEGLSPNASRSEVAKVVAKNYRYETPQRVKIIDTEIVGEYDISEYTIFRELYDYMTDNEYNSIDKVAAVDVNYTVDGIEESTQIICIKMSDKWYFLRGF